MSRPISKEKLSLSFIVLKVLNGYWHPQALLIYLGVVLGHFSEHIAQLYQYLILGWPARKAGGFLGFYFPGLAATEVLHTAYNSLQLTGLILLAYGFKGKGAARTWWLIALIMQTWHWLEHVFLQVQYLTGWYLFNAVKQRSLLELFFPRLELHFVYNLLVIVPTFIAVWLYFSGKAKHKRIQTFTP